MCRETCLAMMQRSHANKKRKQRRKASSWRVVRIRHEPLLLFLSLWHCLGVHIYSDFCLGQAMTDKNSEKERDRIREKRQKREWWWHMKKQREVGKRGEEGRENMRYIQIHMRYHAVSHVVQTNYERRVSWRIQGEIFWFHGCDTGSWMGERNDTPVMWAVCLKKEKEGKGR